MKKIITLIAILAIATTGAVSAAGIKDGDFTGGGFLRTGNDMNKTTNGWQGYTSNVSYDTTDDRVEFDTLGAKRGFGQVIEGAWLSDSDIQLVFDYDIAGGGNATLDVQVWGSDGWAWNSGIVLYDVDNPPRRTDVDVLGKLTIANIATESVEGQPLLLTNIVGSTPSDYYWVQVGFSITRIDVSGGEHGYIDNVDIIPIPEPALLGLLGLGIIAFIRRR